MTKKLQALNLLILLSIGYCCERRNLQPSNPDRSSIEDSIKSYSLVDQIDETDLRKLIQNRNGKILLLNIWATWCQPCVEEFPNLIKLYSSYSTDSLEIVGVSADDLDDTITKVAPFVKKNKVPFKIYIAHFVKQDDFINSLNKTWSGAIPATFFYDINGKQQFMEIGGRTFEQFREKVEQMKNISTGPTKLFRD
jgi:thiol-disulfide isomerase/thioredoxin